VSDNARTKNKVKVNDPSMLAPVNLDRDLFISYLSLISQRRLVVDVLYALTSYVLPYLVQS
jgi:hypothetical protein